jgi:hypothetical protein
MARLFAVPDLVTGLGQLLFSVLREGDVLADRLEILSVLVSVGFADNFSKTERFKRRYEEVVGSEFWNRAEQLYCSREPLRWKTSYRGRLVGVGTDSRDDQLQHIVNALARAPGANTLSFSFYRTADHIRARAIPASMPCPIAGDFKYRRGQLNLSVFFRTHDVYRLGFPDFLFLRRLQHEILDRVQRVAPRRFTDAAVVGELNLFFSRAFVLKRQRAGAERLLRAIVEFQKTANTHVRA